MSAAGLQSGGLNSEELRGELQPEAGGPEGGLQDSTSSSMDLWAEARLVDVIRGSFWSPFDVLTRTLSHLRAWSVLLVAAARR